MTMLDTRMRRNLDWPLLLLTYLLAALGVLIIFSATHGDASAFHKKQIIGVALGTAGLIAAALLDFHLYARFTRHLYVFNLLMLVGVRFVGHSTNGATRWIRIGGIPFQPSEFAKLIVIVTLAVFLTTHYDHIREWKTFLLSFVYVAVPAALILKQPDLGTALVVFAIWVGMVFMAGAKMQHIGAFFGACIVLFCGLWFSGKLLHGYQRTRLEVFVKNLSGQADENSKAGAGYHVYQASVAIGSGQLWGKGWLHSTQVRGGYIPEKQSDFIFTDIGEEWGLVGGLAITILYACLLLRASQTIAYSDEDVLGKLIASGIVTMLAFHVIVNIGMNVGIMPVAGVPLPLISAGNSNVILTLICIGLLQSVSRHRRQLLF